MKEQEVRNQVRQLVTYILNPKERDTDSVISARQEYHKLKTTNPDFNPYPKQPSK